MSLPNKETCVGCIFWEHQPDIYMKDGKRFGQCRHNPPVVMTAPKILTRWPLTADGDWCGEHATLGASDAGL